MVGLDKVYAVDDDSLLDMSVLENPTESLRESMNNLGADMDKHNNDCLVDLYKCL